MVNKGATIWLTGLSGAGKSTIAREIAAALRARGRHVEILDGDEVREHLSHGLGFSREDRDENVRRIGYVAGLVTRNGTIAVVAAISPYRQAREEVRQHVGPSAFVEVHVRCPLDQLVQRDVKGLYARALRGEIPSFTGVSDPYEEPTEPAVVVDTDQQGVEESVAVVVRYLEHAGHVPPADQTSAMPSAPDRRALITRMAPTFTNGEPQDILRWAIDTFDRDRLAVCTSFQAEGMAVLDMAWRIDPRVRVFTIDTGRLPQETYDMVDRVRERYGIEVEVYLPEAQEVNAMVRERGANLFYRSLENRLQCCETRKVRPLERVLPGLDAWATGLRRDQWRTRSAIEPVEVDEQHGGIVKLNPLARWTEDQVWTYLREHDVPVHALYEQGYRSIGCAPCTRPLAEGEDPRAGRWWWETGAAKECGMHCAVELVGTPAPVETAL